MPSWRKVIVSGSDASLNSINVTTNVVAQSFTGSLFGTSSWANNTISSSYAVTSSYTLNALSSSFASTASYVNPLRQNVIVTGSLLVTQSFISTVDYIDFTTTAAPAFLTGRVNWIDDTKTLNIDTDVNNFAIEVGHQNVVRARNVNSFTLTKGTVVYINGESGNRPTIATASWVDDSNSATTLGFVTADIATNGTGYVVTNGLLRGINTTAFSPGTMLYLSASGQYTSTQPLAPLHQVRLGRTITQAVDGTIYVNVINGYELGELHDVLITNQQNGDLITWNSGSRVFQNTKILSGSYGVSGSLNVSQGLTGSLLGTASYATQALSSSFATTASYASNVAVEELGTTIYSTRPTSPTFSTTLAVLLGSAAGNNTAGTGQVFIGSGAGQNSATASYAIGIGRNSANNSVSASYSIVIGHSAGRSATTANSIGQNNIIIGTGISVPEAYQNSINIGGLIFGSGSYFSSAATSRFISASNGKIGINQPNPLYEFDVSGSGNYTNGLSVTGSLNVTQTVSASVAVYSAGDVTAAQNLRSIYSAGDEGGEIFLNKPVTNTAITGGLTIDVYQNKLRIFEQGGTNRGGYWDITALSAGAGTNLLSGGSGATFNGGTNVDNRLITATGTTPELNGEANLTFNGTTLGVTGNVTANSFTGSLLGTSSYASQALSSSYALTSSYALKIEPSAIAMNVVYITGSSTQLRLDSGSINTYYRISTTGTFDVNIDTNSSKPQIPTGSQIIIEKLITGSLTISAASGVGYTGSLYIPYQYQTLTLTKVNTDEWVGVGGYDNQIITFNSQSSTSYTLVKEDVGKMIRLNNASSITVTVPPNSSQAFPIGSIVSMEQQGAGVITCITGSGVTINSTARKSWGQYTVIQVYKVGTDTWNVIGGVD